MNMIQAICDPNLFRPFLGPNLRSWLPWLAALRCVYGLRNRAKFHDLIKQCTGREASSLPPDGFQTALFLTGRRSGKSRIASVIGAYEACLAGHEKKLAKGELGVVAVVSPTRVQSRIVKTYMRAIFDVPLLHAEIIKEDRDGFALRSGVRIDILTGSFRTVRGHTLVAAIVDEAAFFGLEEESRVRSDTELIRALKPGLATARGRLVAISTPYARKGWCYKAFQLYHGKEAGATLVWNCPSRTMNATLPQTVVDEALAEDPQAAKSEFLGEFRDDVAEFLPRALIENLVVPGRRELLPRRLCCYLAFADLSGGRQDDAALAIGHREGRKIVVDCLRRYRAPCNPNDVVRCMCDELRRYGVRYVTGDNYAAEFAASAFRAQGIGYEKSPLPKSGLYLELLPRLCSGEIELLDDEALVGQLASLERRTRSGGKDIVDHPPGGNDDVANAVAGLSFVAAKRRLVVGALGCHGAARPQEALWSA